MKNWYFVSIFIAVLAVVIVLTYDTSLTPSNEGKIIIPPTPKWTLTGNAFISTTISSKVSGAKDISACLAENYESCFLITAWSWDYASYFRAYWTTIFMEMIVASWSTLTTGDMQAQIDAGFHEVMQISGHNNTIWHLADIGLEAQHLYIERSWGTLIITDTLGLKGPSFEDRFYMPYTQMPQHIIIE